MDVETVTAPSGGLLAAVRSTLAGAEDALLCVAFAQSRGVHLVADELAGLTKRGGARVVVTTTLGSSSEAALAAITQSGAMLRVLNPGGATYHPKVFLGRRGRRLHAVVGSANLTSGLVANVEAATAMRGTLADPALATLWSWAEGVWIDPRGRAWTPPVGPPVEEEIEPELLAQLVVVAKASPTLYTLGAAPRPNYVADVGRSGMWVETDRSKGKHEGPQLVPPRMLNLAWDALRARGRLSNRELLDELRVHRSSFVCAALARLPGVVVESRSPIVLRYDAAPRPT